MEVVSHDGRKIIRGVVYNHVIEEADDHSYIGLRGFGFNLFDEDKKEVGR